MPKTEMLINYVPGEECRIAIVRDGRLEEFYQERASAESHVGNIYKGRVTNVEPSIQAAFVDFGLERNGFLHISDLHPMYFPGKDREQFEQVGSKTPHRERPPIQKCLRRGQEILVQVLKEGIGTKGPTLTSYLSIPGRFIVMMPQMQRLGVSRKVEDDDARREARKLLAELNPPKDFGFIIRTAGIGQTKADLKRDLAYLQRLWRSIEHRRKTIGRVGELYTESDLIIRTIRDVFSNEIDRVVVDDLTAARRAYDFLSIASPRSRSKVVHYNDPVPLFHRFDIERQIESIHARQVPLPSGGSLVIDQTEALVAIDVNSGKSREARDAESNAFNTDKEAVDEIARQLRLRDLGGVIVLDLIDMRNPRHRREIEQRFRQNLKRDRARTRIGSISQFGILEMTRQRMRPSLNSSLFIPCDRCAGKGQVKSPESVVLDVMRRLAATMQHEEVARIELTISPDVAFHLLNRKRSHLVELEAKYGKPVTVRVGGATIDHVHIAAFDARGGSVDAEALLDPKRMPAERPNSYVELSAGEALADLEDEGLADEAWEQGEEEQAAEQAQAEAESEEAEAAPAAQEAGSGSRRRRRRRRSRRKGQEGQGESEPAVQAAEAQQEDASLFAPPAEHPAEHPPEHEEESASGEAGEDADASAAPAQAQQNQSQQEGQAASGQEGQASNGRRRRRRRGGRGRRSNSSTPDNGQPQASAPASPPPAKAAEPPPTPVVGSGYRNRLLGDVSSASRPTDRTGSS